MEITTETKAFQLFTGADFTDTYDKSRPSVPMAVVERLLKAFGRQPEAVADLGCGTGLSTLIWTAVCPRVVGVEPSEEMRKEAMKKSFDLDSEKGDTDTSKIPAGLHFLEGNSEKMPIPDASVDIVTVSQAFHFMDPEPTLREIRRVLKPGGIFATIDYDWPPKMDPSLTEAYRTFHEEVKRLFAKTFAGRPYPKRRPKSGHLDNLKTYGGFDGVEEIVLEVQDVWPIERLALIHYSQSSTKSLLRERPEVLDEAKKQYEDALLKACPSKECPITIPYVLRVGKTKFE